MAKDSLPTGTEAAREAAAVIQWHPGFCSAVEFELRKNRDALSFLREYPLTKGPLTADLLVIELLEQVDIDNEIGKLFRRYNLFEFKSPEDSLNIDDYYKTLAYACLFKCSGDQTNEIPAEEITLSLVREAFPREMVHILAHAGVSVERKYPGIYYLRQLSGGGGPVVFPTQIVVTGELDNSTHSSLRILTNHASEGDVRRFLAAAMLVTGQGEQSNVDSILQVSVSANSQVYEQIRRDSAMCQALRELMKDEIQKDIDQAIADATAKVTAEVTAEVTAGVTAKGIRTLVDAYREDMGLDDQTIIEKISARYDLTHDQAKAFVLPHAV